MKNLKTDQKGNIMHIRIMAEYQKKIGKNVCFNLYVNGKFKVKIG